MFYDVVAAANGLWSDVGVALEGAGVEGAWDVVALEDVQDAPDADAAALLETGLVGEVSLTRAEGRRRLPGGLAGRIAVERGVL